MFQYGNGRRRGMKGQISIRTSQHTTHSNRRQDGKNIQGKGPSAETCHRIWYVVIWNAILQRLKKT